MSFGLYKSGHGYWVRVMTAAMLGLLTIATAAWVWNQAGLASESLPDSRWVMAVPSADDAAPGSTATFEFFTDGGVYEPIGTATVKELDENKELTFTGAESTTPDQGIGDTSHVTLADGTRYEVVGTPIGQKSIEPLYIQGVCTALVLIAGALISYWFAGVKKGSVDFLVATDGEMRKVNWSTRRDVIQSTNVVILITVILAVVLFGFDTAFTSAAQAIGLLAK